MTEQPTTVAGLAYESGSFVMVIRGGTGSCTKFSGLTMLDVESVLNEFQPKWTVVSVDCIAHFWQTNRKPQMSFFFTSLLPGGSLVQRIQRTMDDVLPMQEEWMTWIDWTMTCA